MVTGDSAQCGHYIGRACGMVAEGADVLLADVGLEGEVTWSFMGASSQEAKLQTSFTTVQVGPAAVSDCCCLGDLLLLESVMLQVCCCLLESAVVGVCCVTTVCCQT